jgi:hypothetical protein
LTIFASNASALVLFLDRCHESIPLIALKITITAV